MWRLHRNRAFLFPPNHQKIRHVLHDVAQRMDVRVRRIRTELNDEVSVADVLLQGVVGETGHALQKFRLQRLQTETIIEQ